MAKAVPEDGFIAYFEGVPYTNVEKFRLCVLSDWITAGLDGSYYL
jgi:hypothetical protein